jgi:hypothetical protein
MTEVIGAGLGSLSAFAGFMTGECRMMESEKSVAADRNGMLIEWIDCGIWRHTASGVEFGHAAACIAVLLAFC